MGENLRYHHPTPYPGNLHSSMTPQIVRCAASLTLLSCTAVVAQSTSVYTFIQGARLRIDDVPVGFPGETYNGTEGANLIEGAPDLPVVFGDDSGDGPEFAVDADDPNGSGLETVAVLRFGGIFDVLPDNAEIVSASLFIDIDNGGDDMLLYQLAGTFDWTQNPATWNNFGTSANDGVVVGTDTVGDAVTIPGDGDKVVIDITTIVQSWFAGAENNGVVFLPTGNNGVDFDGFATGRRFGNDPFDRPRLNLEIRVPEPGVVGLGLGVLALGLAWFARRRRA